MMWRRIILVIASASFLLASDLSAQSQSDQVPPSVLQQAAAEFQQGNLAEADRILRVSLKQAPRDSAALSLRGVILDAQKRYDEAEETYKKALTLTPRSPSLLNNLGNHYLAMGKSEEARQAFL